MAVLMDCLLYRPANGLAGGTRCAIARRLQMIVERSRKKGALVCFGDREMWDGTSAGIYFRLFTGSRRDPRRV